jgi:hypothetical protein
MLPHLRWYASMGWETQLRPISPAVGKDLLASSPGRPQALL